MTATQPVSLHPDLIAGDGNRSRSSDSLNSSQSTNHDAQATKTVLRYPQIMAQVTLEIPEELSAALSSPGQDQPRALLESLALEAYRERKPLNRSTRPDSRHL